MVRLVMVSGGQSNDNSREVVGCHIEIDCETMRSVAAQPVPLAIVSEPLGLM